MCEISMSSADENRSMDSIPALSVWLPVFQEPTLLSTCPAPLLSHRQAPSMPKFDNSGNTPVLTTCLHSLGPRHALRAPESKLGQSQSL